MSRGPWGIKPSQVKRAITAVLQTGLAVAEVKFEKDGGFSVIPCKPADTSDDRVSAVTTEDLGELI